MLLRDHGDDVAVAAERWLLEALVSWASAQVRRGHGRSGRKRAQQAAASMSLLY